MEALFKMQEATNLNDLNEVSYLWHKLLQKTRGAETMCRHTLRTVWLRKIERVPDVKPYLIQWEILPDNHEDKTYEKLMVIVATLLAAKRDTLFRHRSDRAIEDFLQKSSNKRNAVPGEVSGSPTKGGGGDAKNNRRGGGRTETRRAPKTGRSDGP